MTNNYKTVFDFCVKCGYSEETIKKRLSDDGKVWDASFYCSNNKLTSLEGCPKFINGDIYL